jgi:hypothetical protein
LFVVNRQKRLTPIGPVTLADKAMIVRPPLLLTLVPAFNIDAARFELIVRSVTAASSAVKL